MFAVGIYVGAEGVKRLSSQIMHVVMPRPLSLKLKPRYLNPPKP